MKKILLSLLLAIPYLGFAQSSQPYAPFVKMSSMDPSPMMPVESNGSGWAVFVFGNEGTEMMPLVANQELTLIITFARGVPNVADPTNVAELNAAITGTFASYFDWVYEPSDNTFAGFQNKTIPAFSLDPNNPSSGTIMLPYKVVQNSPETSPQNGFNCNIVPPGYTNGFNDEVDDNTEFYTWTQAGIALPVAGLSLSATRIGNNVNLNWTTLGEQKTSHFIIERSAERGASYQKIGNQVAAAGHSTQAIKYELTDFNATFPVLLYRVKVVDIDGKSSHSNVVLVRQATEMVDVRIFPNPATNFFFVKINGSGLFRIQLIDGMGKIVLSQQAYMSGTGSTATIRRGTLPAGEYRVKITDEKGMIKTTPVLFVK